MSSFPADLCRRTIGAAVAASAVFVVLMATVFGCSTAEETAPPSSPSNPVVFFREYVKVTPMPDRTHVSGLYYFRNDSDEPIEQGILYPFPVDSDHLYPRTIRVWELEENGRRPMGFLHRDRAIAWLMRLEPREEAKVLVDYVQETTNPHAVYIVSSTQRWDDPLELAEFEFMIPPELTDVRLSFEPDTQFVRGDTTVYYMKRTEFMPDYDLTVEWRDERNPLE